MINVDDVIAELFDRGVAEIMRALRVRGGIAFECREQGRDGSRTKVARTAGLFESLLASAAVVEPQPFEDGRGLRPLGDEPSQGGGAVNDRKLL